MRLGVVGLGKVGLPLTLVLAEAGHAVTGYDVAPDRVKARLALPIDDGEVGLGELIRSQTFRLADSLAELADLDAVLVIVQTPHDPEYGGHQPMPAETRDFNYDYLTAALTSLNTAANATERVLPVIVVSTVLPGTTARLAATVPNLRLVYSPVFISLGTVVPDLQHPDFVLAGSTDDTADLVEAIWREVHDQPVYRCGVESAELLKVSMNCFISMKIMFANALMELSEAAGADVDEVTDGLALSRKVTTAAYLHAGLGDGGPCRPRDAIAMSWLGEQHGLSFDPFRWLVQARETQSSWLAGYVRSVAETYQLPIFLLGRTYKPGLRLVDGSAADLLNCELQAPVWDPMLDDPVPDRNGPQAFVIGTPHLEFHELKLPAGSVVIDPFGYFDPQPDVTYIPVGRGRRQL